MKRTYPTNVDGQIFYIDEDAFLLLQNYLTQLKSTFTGTEGQEIVGDIESRIRELFAEKLNAGAGVIVLADVEKVIETMGRPEDISGDCADENDTDNAAGDEASSIGRKDSTAPFISINLPSHKKLYRNLKDKVFGGVIGGLAVYLGWNANIMRLLYILLIFGTIKFISGWPLVILYLVAWMIIPPARTPRQMLQMHGTPVNVDTIGQSVMAEAGTTPPPYKENNNFFSTMFSIIGKCITGFMGLISAVLTVGCTILFLCIGTGILCWYIAGVDTILTGLSLAPLDYHTISPMWSALTGSLLGMIIFGIISWACGAVTFSFSGPSKSTTISLSIIAIMLIVATIVLFSACF